MITAEHNFANFKLTMAGLETGLRVIHITTPTAQLLCCEHDETIETVLARSDLRSFDQIPVKEQETIIGLLKRGVRPDKATGYVRDSMLPLAEKTLVSAATPLLEFIQNDPLDRIVIDGTKIYGLVTRSDLLKLPVFLLGFALVTQVETLMLDMIRATGVSEKEWLQHTNKKRIQKHFNRLARERSELDLLASTSFADKKAILDKLSDSREYVSHLPNKSLLSSLKDIHPLRNTIAHTGDTADDDGALQKFIDRLRIAHHWVEDIKQWRTVYANTLQK